MQVLWSRTARATSCRCTTCIHSATTTLARRTTTATSKRRAKLGDVFTAFYSAVLATAAVADAKIKDDRRKQWDRVIAGAKAGKDTTSDDPEIFGGQSIVFSSSMERTHHEADSLRVCSSLPALREPLIAAAQPQSHTMPLERQLKLLDSHLQQSFKPYEAEGADIDELGRYIGVNSRSEVQTLEEWFDRLGVQDADISRKTDASAIHDGGRLGFAQEDSSSSVLEPREPNQMVHVLMMEKMVAELVTALLLNTKAFSTRKGTNKPVVDGAINKDVSSGQPDVDDLVPESNRVSGRWQVLDAGKMHSTRFPKYSDLKRKSSWMTERSLLEESIRSIFTPRYSKPKSTDLMIAKLCYNLLISTTPPSVDTYNLMIESFTELGDHDSAQIVIHSFFRRSKFRANERTITAVLRHYTLTKDTRGFRQTVQQMRGVEDGFRLRKRHQSTLYRPDIQKWALSHKIMLRNSYAYERVPRNSAIFEALIYGTWELMGLKAALKYFKASICEGQLVSAAVFVHLARGCLGSEDSETLCILLLRNFLVYWRRCSYAPNLITKDPKAREYLQKVMKKIGIDIPSESKPVEWLPYKIMRMSKKLRVQVGALDPRQCFNYMIRQVHIDFQEEKVKESLSYMTDLKELFESYKSTLTEVNSSVVTVQDLTGSVTAERNPKSAADAVGTVEAQENSDTNLPITAWVVTASSLVYKQASTHSSAATNLALTKPASEEPAPRKFLRVTRRLKGVEYRPAFMDYRVFDQPTTMYAKAGDL